MRKIARLILSCIFIITSCFAAFAGDVRFLSNRDYYTALQEKIDNAAQEIIISVYLFRTTDSPDNLASKIADSLVRASGRGVKVSVLLEKEKPKQKGSNLNRDNERTAHMLKSGGVKVYMDGTDTTTHAKLVSIDGRFVFAGSHNFTDSALRWNNEASVMIDSKELAEEAASFIKKAGGI